MNIPNKNELTRIYGEAEKSAARFQAVADHFAEIYHHDIAEFFTISNDEDKYGDITVNSNGEIIGIPDIKNISTIKDAIKKLIEEYPYPIDIYFEKGCVIFTVGDNVTVEYDANKSFDDNAYKITNHWIATKTK